MRITDEQIDDMIRIADKDGDGDISYVEFIKLMTSKAWGSQSHCSINHESEINLKLIEIQDYNDYN